MKIIDPISIHIGQSRHLIHAAKLHILTEVEFPQVGSLPSVFPHPRDPIAIEIEHFQAAALEGGDLAEGIVLEPEPLEASEGGEQNEREIPQETVRDRQVQEPVSRREDRRPVDRLQGSVVDEDLLEGEIPEGVLEEGLHVRVVCELELPERRISFAAKLILS